MKEKEIREKIEKGYIHFSSIIEVLGKPKEHVKETIKQYVEKIKKNKNFTILDEQYSEPKEQDDLFSTFVELEALAKNSAEILFFCFDYMPSSIEIIQPEEITYRKNEFSGFLNDMQARLHAIDMALKQYKSRNTMLIKNSAVLLRNMVIITLEKDEKTIEEITKKIGIKKEQLENVLNVMIKENRIKKKGKKYGLK
jgi:hypothetical protein